MRQVGAGSEDKRESAARDWPAAGPKGVGRLFVTDVPGQDSWCTATAIGGDVAITAAHCVWPGYMRDDWGRTSRRPPRRWPSLIT